MNKQLQKIPILIAVLVMAPTAMAARETFVSYNVAEYLPSAPNAPAYWVAGDSNQQSSSTQAPVSAGNSSFANLGYGYANTNASANAALGVLGAKVYTSAFAESRVGTSTYGEGRASATAFFADEVTFNVPGMGPNQLATINGQLLLTGSQLLSGGFTTFNSGYAITRTDVSITGTGLYLGDARSSTWDLSCSASSCRESTAMGDIINTIVPAAQYSIPFSFGAFVNTPSTTHIEYGLKMSAYTGTFYPACTDSLGGGLCDVYSQADPQASADYSHTLRWGGITVTNQYGTPVVFTVNSTSGFNYAQPAPVPVPAAAWLFGSGLLGLIGVARRKTRAA